MSSCEGAGQGFRGGPINSPASDSHFLEAPASYLASVPSRKSLSMTITWYGFQVDIV